MDDKKIKQDVKLILDYLWRDEEKHYQEIGKESKEHVFQVLKRLAKNTGYRHGS
jgi:hypothetical protein